MPRIIGSALCFSPVPQCFQYGGVFPIPAGMNVVTIVSNLDSDDRSLRAWSVVVLLASANWVCPPHSFAVPLVPGFSEFPSRTDVLWPGRPQVC